MTELEFYIFFGIIVLVAAILIGFLVKLSHVEVPRDTQSAIFDEYNYGLVVFIKVPQNQELVEKAIALSRVSYIKTFDDFNRAYRYDISENASSYSTFLDSLAEVFASNHRSLHFYKDTESSTRTVYVLYDEE